MDGEPLVDGDEGEDGGGGGGREVDHSEGTVRLVDKRENGKEKQKRGK